MMKRLKSSDSFHIWAGGLCAVLAGWLSVAFGLALTFVLIDRAWGATVEGWLVVGLIAFWLSVFPLAGWIMGVICAGFWSKIVTLDAHYNWAVAVMATFLAPLLLLGCGGVMLSAVLFMATWFPLRHSLDKPPRWRHFFGLSNDWERDP